MALRNPDGKGFLIVGDSWSQGEIENYNWGAQSHIVVHRGLTQYLMDDGHRVHNRGGLGWSNIEAYFQMESSFRDNTHVNYPKPIEDNIDYIIWFTTDSLRDIQEKEYNERLQEKGSIRQVIFDILEEVYARFDKFAKEIDKKVYLVGAWAPVHSSISKYSNLVPLIDDVHEFLVPGSNISLTHSALQLFDHVRQSADLVPDVKQEIIELTDEWAHAEDIRKANPEWFFPDEQHANRAAHYKIYEKVKEVILNESG